MSRTRAFGAIVIVLAICAAAAHGAEPDANVIAKVTGLTPEVKNGIAKVTLPRTDLAVTVDGVTMRPFQGLTSWAAFQPSGSETVVMGDLTLAEDEVSPAMSAALDNGLEVTALHNHFSFDHPRILFMHIAGTGSTEALASGVRKALDAMKEVRRNPTPAASFGGPAIPTESTIDAPALGTILGGQGQTREVNRCWRSSSAMVWPLYGGADRVLQVGPTFSLARSRLGGYGGRHGNETIPHRPGSSPAVGRQRTDTGRGALGHDVPERGRHAEAASPPGDDG